MERRFLLHGLAGLCDVWPCFMCVCMGTQNVHVYAHNALRVEISSVIWIQKSTKTDPNRMARSYMAIFVVIHTTA